MRRATPRQALMEKNRLKITYLLRPYWKRLGIALVAVIIEGAMDLLDPWPLKLVFDQVIGHKKVPAWMDNIIGATIGHGRLAVLDFAAASVVIIAVIGAISSYVENYLTTSVGQWIMHDLRRTLYHHVQRLSISYHENHKTGDLISRVTGDIDAIQTFISSALLGMLVDVLTLVGMVGIMFYMNWGFTLIALSVAPVLFISVYLFTRRIKQAAREVRKKEGQIVSTVAEVVSSMRVVKAFSREDYEEHRLEKESMESVEAALHARAMKALLSPTVEIIVAAGTCLVVWYGGRLALSGGLSAGALVVFLLYLGKMYKPMRDLSKQTDTVSKAAVGWERVKEVLQTELQVRDLPGARQAPRLTGNIEFRNVCFGYDSGRTVLKDLSFNIAPGTVAALVGPTGAGKSTIISLLPRFYDPQSGRVNIDDFDVRRLKLQSLRQQFSFVLQETTLFHAPIWQNIAYGKPEAKYGEIMRAAKLANAHEFIDRLPDGYNTIVGERGMTLSGGERQRIAIARAIIRDSPILIMDEPSSGLDAASEEIVFEALGRLMEGRTSIVIAHRLATVRNADVIFVIKEGMIHEQGNHRQLLALGGLYSELFNIQFRTKESSGFLEPAAVAG
ncbi:MAG TPA: ABC transporter ATP-binding protein [Blastocatellia bacterium]